MKMLLAAALLLMVLVAINLSAVGWYFSRDEQQSTAEGVALLVMGLMIAVWVTVVFRSFYL